MRQLEYTMFISNNRTSFHLWWKEDLAKHWKVSKYYETDCRYQISAQTDNFDFLDQIFPKRVFPVKKGKIPLVRVSMAVTFRTGADRHNSILMSLFLLAAETKRYWTSLPRSFSAWFLQKNVSPVYSINSQNFLVWLHFLLEILRNMCIVIVYFPVYGITSSLSPTWPKRSEQKFKYLENEKSFQDETKIIFHHFPKAFIDANKTNILESGKVYFCKGYEGIIHKLRFLVL